jgi:hypothetical protein
VFIDVTCYDRVVQLCDVLYALGYVSVFRDVVWVCCVSWWYVDVCYVYVFTWCSLMICSSVLCALIVCGIGASEKDMLLFMYVSSPPPLL